MRFPVKMICILLLMAFCFGLLPMNVMAEESGAALAVPLYFQTEYPNTRYASGTIASNGSGITCLAMAATAMTGQEYLPDMLADWFGGYGQNNIERLEYASDMLQLPWEKAENIHKVFSALEEGKMAIVLMNGNSIFSEGQHFLLLTGLNEEGKILVNDPYEPNYSHWRLKNAYAAGFAKGDIQCGYSGGWIYDVGAMPEEPFVYTEVTVETEPRYPEIQLTDQEMDLLAKVVWAEARGESPEGQQAVAEVIFNRLVSDDFPDTVRGVLYAENQFPSTELLKDAAPTQAQYDAIENALSGPYILPEEVVYYATYPVTDQVWGSIGGHIFCYRSET